MQQSTARALLFATLTIGVVAISAVSLHDAATRERSRGNWPRAGEPRDETPRRDLVSLAREAATGRSDPVVRESIEASFRAEDVDPAWSMAKERQLALVISNMRVPGSSLLDVECRETICLARLLFERRSDTDRLDDFSNALERNTNLEILGDMSVAPEGDGASISVFLARLP